LPGRKAEVQAGYLEWRDQPDAATKKKFLDALTELSRDAELIDDAILKQQTRAALDASRDAAEAPPTLDADIAAMTGLALPERAALEIQLTTQEAAEPAAGEMAAPASIELMGEEAGLAGPIEIETDETAAPATDAAAELEPPLPTSQAALTEAADMPAAAPDNSSAETALQVSIPEGVESELLEIFLEEANEVLATMGEASNACQSDPDDQASLTVIRRAFHTLKGSGRMVGLSELGETAWRHEQLLNGWLAENKAVSNDLLRLVGRARGVFQDWVDALQANEAVTLPVAALLAAVDRVAQGQPLDSPEAGDAMQDQAGIKASLPETEAEWQPLPVAEVESVPEHDDAAAAIEHEAVADGEGENTAPAMEMEGTEAVEAAPAQADEAVELPNVATALDVGAIIEYAAAKPAVVEPATPVVPDEICIGQVCISTGLYEIFMTEAHQRLAVLQEEAERHADIAHSTVSEHARRAVHTLGGIAGTAGIAVLSELSHALEQYWNRFVQVPLPLSHVSLVQDTVARLREMIATIESGHLPEAANDLIATLGELEDEQSMPAAEATPLLADEIRAETIASSALSADTPFADEASGSEPAETGHANPAHGLPDVSAMVSEIKPATPSPVFERREVADEIDQQLLPIFLEEADTLVPDTSAQLRAWIAAPGEAAARDALRRNLHTIKGSARMVGAMRLGELTHVMESRVIAVIEGHLAASGDVFNTLEAQLDHLAEAVERLKQGDFAPIADEATAPLEAPVEPVVGQTATAHAVTAAIADPRAPAQPATRDSNALTLRVRADWVDRMVNQAGEVAIARSRIESEVFAFKRHVNELSEALVRLRGHIREVEIQAESQMQATFQTQGVAEQFDPLEFDRFTRFQEVTRFLAESVNDISTVQHILLARLGEADAALIQQTRLNRELQQDLLRVRMVPLYSVAERLYRTVRQTARDVDKRAQLDIQGGELEIDRSVLEKVTAPLEHLLRNALAHGIESPEERHAAGKAEFGEIVLSARQSGNEMMLTVKDDGAGLNYARIREKAEASGLLLPGTEPTETLLAQMIFAAGFSTAETVSQVAGRGVGMDVVKSEISALGGRIDIASTPGAGTSFNIYLPLTLAMTQAVMVQAARHDYALPTPLVQQVLELKPVELERAMVAGEVEWRGARYPFSYLPHLLGDTEALHEVQRYNPVVLLQSGTSQAAVLVDVIEGTREIVVKNIGPQMARITGVVGATVRGDGRVMLILNPVPLALRWASLPRTAVERSAPAEAIELSTALQPPMVLVVDDSLTVRKITTRLLTREGFRVDSAKDGVDALERMHDLVPDVVLLDVEMPRMDGFELARVMRSDERLKSVPIIMITSRTADKHRNHAMEIGVNVYLGKPYQEQQLLDAIAEQLGQEVPLPA